MYLLFFLNQTKVGDFISTNETIVTEHKRDLFVCLSFLATSSPQKQKKKPQASPVTPVSTTTFSFC